MKIDYFKDIYEDFYKQIEFDSRNNELSDTVKAIIYSIEHSPLTLGHAHYIIDYFKKEVIYQKGIKELFGFDKNEFNLNTIATYTHPDDYDRYAFIVKSVFDYFSINTVEPFDVMFSITARLKRKDGSYVNTMRNTTIIEVNDKNKMLKSYSLLSDISNVKKDNQIMWKCVSKAVDTKELENFVREKHNTIFTKRELEILSLLKSGLASKEIADKLFLSKHTIDTHRRKMLAKASCTNTVELVEFSNNNLTI